MSYNYKCKVRIIQDTELAVTAKKKAQERDEK